MAQHIVCRLLKPIHQLTSKQKGNFLRYLSSDISSGDMYPSPKIEPWIPPYVERENEPSSLKKARLLYQSRKRGMLENGLILSTFASRYLDGMSDDHLSLYDRLINLPSNDWDIYYWATGVRQTPEEFNNEVMDLLKEHVRNKDKESRFKQPDLY
ncbi:hypothetical protein GHT06_017538 [Daphnia sinensis]|uniref:Succinate dehydrogenase assembly factor 2, mitochondrial n=1 Tax=Daphnia sinensis TaxID=1820382 RepID=A0AAD5KQZ3_9CRUS|nr:hypothetical protein GHT06_017538 [Daphnia sinensis]